MATRVTKIIVDVVVSSTAPTTITPPVVSSGAKTQIVWVGKKK